MLPHVFNGLPYVERFYSLTETESTNTFARKLGDVPRKGITIVQAERQTAGRGRSGNSFFSFSDGGLWVTIISHIGSIACHFTHNRAISLGICKAITDFIPDAPLRIKWPNDIYWNNKKLAGILLENIPNNNHALVMGFGLNVSLGYEDFPESVQHIATSIFIESRKRLSRSGLLRKIIERYHEFVIADVHEIHALYLQHLYRVGSLAIINDMQGTFETVAPDGALVLSTTSGEQRICSGTLRFIE
jgi:BirA family transcriptional regulator, biotin operon repressor / biotin---[acetyl-CoA-carboxylase] ligase